jgi:hypothetical protein
VVLGGSRAPACAAWAADAAAATGGERSSAPPPQHRGRCVVRVCLAIEGGGGAAAAAVLPAQVQRFDVSDRSDDEPFDALTDFQLVCRVQPPPSLPTILHFCDPIISTRTRTQVVLERDRHLLGAEERQALARLFLPPGPDGGDGDGDGDGRVASVSLTRLLDESPWLQFTSECRRFGPPPRLNDFAVLDRPRCWRSGCSCARGLGSD